MKKQHTFRSGFALIDIVIYIALFSVLIGGISVSAYNLFTSTHKNAANILVLEEGNFLLAKISWVIQETDTVTTPVNNTSSTLLSVIPYNLELGTSIEIKLIDGTLTMKRKNITSSLSNSNVTVSDLLFTHQSTNEIESIESTLTLTALSSTGQMVTADFSTINFLHQ